MKELKYLENFFNKLSSKSDNKWIFRGERYTNKEDVLKTKLEMCFEQFGLEDAKKKRKAERDVIREFQRKLHLYMDHLPTRADISQWLAIMQHHGAPTRLLDWTYSFWIAVHFATARQKLGDYARVWAVNTREIRAKQKKLADEVHEKWKERPLKEEDIPYGDSKVVKDNMLIHHLLREKEEEEKVETGVYAAAGFRLNERITIQQGTFLIPGDIEKTFHKNLSSTITKEDDIQSRTFKVTKPLKKRICENLRQMNVSNAVLFPGLEGFSESLWTRVGLPVKSPDTPLWS